MLLFNCTAAEKKLAEYDAKHAKKAVSTRKANMKKLGAELEEEFEKLQQRSKKTAVVNRARLLEMQPETKKKLDAAVKARNELLVELNTLRPARVGTE